MGEPALGHAVDPAQAPERYEPSGTTERVVAVIDAIARRGDAGVRELALALGISRSATHRIAQTLARRRVLHPLPSGRYEPGPRMLAWAGSLATRDPLLAVGRTVLTELAGSTEETAYIVGYSPDDTTAIVLDVAQGTLPIRYTLPVGSFPPLSAGAAGKAILAWLDDDVVSSQPQLRIRDATLGGGELIADLAAIRERGYATSIGERIAAAAGAAAPIFRHGDVAGAVGISIPRHRLVAPDMAPFGELVRDAAQRITASLGAEPFPECLTETSTSPGPEPGAIVGGRDVARVVDVIDAVARSPAAGVDTATLAQELGVTTGAVASTMRRLGGARIVRSDAQGRHLPEVGLLAWSGLLPDHDVADVARELIAELVEEVGETVCLLSYDAAAAEGRYVLTHSGAHPIQYVIAVGSRAPLHAGAGGKAILAHIDRDAWPQPPLQAYTPATMTSIDALEIEVEKIRRRGFATSTGEQLADAAGVAAPYFVDRIAAGSVTISMPHYRFDAELVPTLVRPLLRCCAELTELLSEGGAYS